MINLKNTLWKLTKQFKVNDKYFPTLLNLGNYTQNAIRINTTYTNSISSNFIDGSITCFLLIYSDKYILEKKDLFIGENFIILPTDKFTNINLKLINNYKGYTVKTSGELIINCYQPSTQIIVNPITNETVILGQESLNAIESLNQNLSQRISTEIIRILGEATITGSVNNDGNTQTLDTVTLKINP